MSGDGTVRSTRLKLSRLVWILALMAIRLHARSRIMNLEPYVRFTRELATLSANEILPRFRKPDLGIEAKADEPPVTIADRRAEEVMRDKIQKQFPTHGIVGEEFGNERVDAEWVWVLAPIDGTKSFIPGCHSSERS